MNSLEYLTFYKNRDNSVLLKLYQSNVLFDHTTITKAEIKWKASSVNSVNNPSMFTIDINGIRLKLGSLSVTPPTEIQAKLIVYTNGWPNGVVWNSRLNIKIQES